jgi:prepilin-type processing-associated H-X9-DG protein
MLVDYASHSGQPATQGLAIGALVCGIIGLLGCPPVGIVGLILGIVAVVKASQAPERYGGKGLAIGGICTGAVSILFVPLLISILLPSLSRARELSKRTVCAANMRGIGQSMYIYAQDGGMFPEEGADWQGRLVGAGLTMPQQFLCPSDSLVSGSSYYYVPGYGVESDPEQVILYEDPAIHGGEGGNILTQDGHVGFVRSPRYEEMIDSITLPDGTPWAPHKGP